MPAYSESLVSDAKKHLAIAIDYALNDCRIEPHEFTELFIGSGIAGLFEEGNPAVVSGMSGTELARSILSFAYGDAEFPSARYPETPTPAYWAGWALAQCQWESGRRFVDIFRAVPLSETLLMYDKYHEMDVTHFTEEVERRIAASATPSRLKELRRQRGLSQSQLANLSGVNVRNIQLYEQGRNDIDKAQGRILYRLARVLGCHIEDLLENPFLD